MDINKVNWTNSKEKIKMAFPIAKVDKEKRTVSGFATLDNLDRHGDIVSPEASEKAFSAFRGNLREMHQPIAVGKVVSFEPQDFFDPETNAHYKGIYVDAYISTGAQNTWEKVLDGTLTGFSIGGDIVEASYDSESEEEGSSKTRIIKDYELTELSLVDNPANPLANIFSIQKNNGGLTANGISTEVSIENVFWCSNDQVANTADTDKKECVICGANMKSIGWVESKDINKTETVRKLILGHFQKGMPEDLEDVDKTIDSGTTINPYPDQDSLEKAGDGFVPPEGVRSAARRALEWIKDGKAGGGFTDVGRKRAADLAAGRAVSAETIGRMKSFFARHGVDSKATGFSSGEDGYPSPGRVAWDAWGGDAGRSWSEKVYNSLEKIDQYEDNESDESLEKSGISVGDFVKWGSSGGNARGKVKKIIRNGSYNVPDSSFTITGTEDDPAAAINVYTMKDEKFVPTDRMVGHKLSTLTKISMSIKKSADEALSKGGDEEMENDNNVAAPVEEAAELLETVAPEPIEKAATVSEIPAEEGKVVKLLEELNEKLASAFEKNYAETADNSEKLEKAVEGISANVSDSIGEFDGKISKLVDRISEIAERLNALETATAIKKSGDAVTAYSDDKKITKSIWSGHFLGTAEL